jgi:hypothetical protein
MDLEPLPGEIKTDPGNRHDGRLPSLWRFATTTFWHINAGSGAVHIIKLVAGARNHLDLLLVG